MDAMGATAGTPVLWSVHFLASYPFAEAFCSLGWKFTFLGIIRDEFRETASWSEGPLEFMYFRRFLLSVLFTATISVVELPAFLLQHCA